MEGYILLDKPAGWTSFDAVKYIRVTAAKAIAQKQHTIRVGHSGTLDPFATGLLIILIGKKYTIQAADLLKMDKKYLVGMELDSISTTGDPEGDIRAIDEPGPLPTRAELIAAMDKFIGEIDQIPPIYSAIKINGVRAYKLARAHQPITMQRRQVNIKGIELLDYVYPRVNFHTEVSSGTYIRSLVEDIGKALGKGAYTNQLRRTAIGKYSIKRAATIQEINEHTIKDLLSSRL